MTNFLLPPHQQDDADFSQQLNGAEIFDRWPRCEWPNQDAANDVAEDERLSQPSGQQPAEQGGNEDVGEIAIKNRARFHATPRERYATAIAGSEYAPVWSNAASADSGG